MLHNLTDTNVVNVAVILGSPRFVGKLHRAPHTRGTGACGRRSGSEAINKVCRRNPGTGWSAGSGDPAGSLLPLLGDQRGTRLSIPAGAASLSWLGLHWSGPILRVLGFPAVPALCQMDPVVR